MYTLYTLDENGGKIAKMTSKEIIQKLMRVEGLTYEEMARRLNYSSKSTVHRMMNNNDGMNMKLETFINWLDELNAEIVIQPFSSEDEFVLDGISEED
jgi:DNA-binding CsgD family transcriptional regulator